jgi:hypothetical protein
MHIGRHSLFNEPTLSGYGLRLDNIVQCCQWIAEVVREHKPDVVINGGDTFDTIGHVTSDSLSAVGRGIGCIDQACGDVGAEHLVIVGNHDLYHESGLVSPIDVFDGYTNVRLIKNDVSFDMGGREVLLLPYTRDSEYANSILRSFQQRGGGLVFSHLDVKGMRITPTYVSDTGIDSDFDGIMVYSGHYHTYNVQGNWLVCVGSALQHRYTEYSDVRGIVMVDPSDMTHEVIRNTVSPVLWKTNTLDGLEGLPDHSYVLFEYDPREVDVDQIRECTARFSKVLTSELIVPKRPDIRVEFKGKSDAEVFSEYVTGVMPDTGVDKTEVLKLGEEIVNKYAGL